MNPFKKWAEKEYSLLQRILVLIPAAVLFLCLIPYLLLDLAPKWDDGFGLAPLEPGWPLQLAGALLLVVGLGYALWSISAQLLHAQGTPLPIMPTHNLLTSGLN